jgi:hypothetical protein
MAASYLFSNPLINGLYHHNYPYGLPNGLPYYHHDLLGQPQVVNSVVSNAAQVVETVNAEAAIVTEKPRAATPPPPPPPQPQVSIASASTVNVEPLLFNSFIHHQPNHYRAYHHSTLDFPLHPETVAEIESRIQSAAVATTRSPIVKNEVIPVEGPAGRVKHIVKRLPTPAPDVINRTVIVKPHKDIVEVFITI